MAKRIYNEHGAHDREVSEHLRQLDADDLLRQAYRTLVDAGYESRDAQAYLTEALTCCAAEDRIRKGLDFRKAQRTALAPAAEAGR